MKILLGVTSSIAIYKALDLVSLLRKKGHEISVIMTQNATKMVSPIPFHSLSANIVAYDEFKEKDYIPHISLSDWADVLAIVPATANILGKMAHGIADDLLSTTYLAFNRPVLAAPAMNVKMFSHPAVKENIEILKKLGVCFVEPATGMLACGYEGKGKLAPVEEIAAALEALNPQTPRPLAGQKVVVTSGGTIEDLDPVRYITNRSSGKMGFAFAEAAQKLGAEVTLIYGHVSVPVPCGMKTLHTRSALEMLEALKTEMKDARILIMAAAVADYRPALKADQKMKKNSSDRLTLELVENPDLLKTLAPSKKPHQVFVGFALETENLMENAAKKLQSKNLDLIVANSPENFDSDQAGVKLLDPSGSIETLSGLSKAAVAQRVLERVAALL